MPTEVAVDSNEDKHSLNSTSNKSLASTLCKVLLHAPKHGSASSATTCGPLPTTISNNRRCQFRSGEYYAQLGSQVTVTQSEVLCLVTAGTSGKFVFLRSQIVTFLRISFFFMFSPS